MKETQQTAEERRAQQNQEILEGKQAEELMAHPAYVTNVTRAKTECINVIINTKLDQSEVREEAYRRIKALDMFTAQLQAAVSRGKVAGNKQVSDDAKAERQNS